MLSPHPASALEYWFFKVNAGRTAILVDWIARRRTQEHWLRVSIHSPHKREVLFKKQSALMPADSYLNLHRTAGQIGDVQWELSIDVGRDWIKPDLFPAGLLRMTDLSLVSAPTATFTGWIRHGGQQTMLESARGVVSHYWGRQLPSEWWWLSASQFDKGAVAVECSVLRSGFWGSKMHMQLAYLYLRQQDRRSFSVVPFGLASVTGSPEAFEVRIHRPFAPAVRLLCAGRSYGDLEDGIINTLVGDLEVWEGRRLVARALGTAGLERRSPS